MSIYFQVYFFFPFWLLIELDLKKMIPCQRKFQLLFLKALQEQD